MTGRLKLGFVVQRYGVEIAGGAEYHCRLIAELLKDHAEVDVFTTCALDYVEWKNHYPEGEAILNGVRVLRFPVARPRDILRFAAISEAIQSPQHTAADEEGWMDEQGPYSPALRDHVVRVADEGRYDALIFFSYRYWTTCRSLLPSRPLRSSPRPPRTTASIGCLSSARRSKRRRSSSSTASRRGSCWRGRSAARSPARS